MAPTPQAPSPNRARAALVAAILAAITAGGVKSGLDVALDHNEGPSALKAYRDMGGVWTLCRGVTSDVKAGDVRTREECKSLDDAEAQKSLDVVRAGFTKEPAPALWVAFADFEYNVGKTAFMQSTARQLINEGRIREGCLQLMRWTYVRGRVIQWQVQRRSIEYDLCMRAAP